MAEEEHESVSGYALAGHMDLAKRQQDFEFAERRARLVFEMARDLGLDKDGIPYVDPAILHDALAELMAAGR